MAEALAKMIKDAETTIKFLTRWLTLQNKEKEKLKQEVNRLQQEVRFIMEKEQVAELMEEQRDIDSMAAVPMTSKEAGTMVETRRGVRSDAQLSCTETRFEKCSQSGRNGSKPPMLSISMAFNVISCKKVERNTQKLKIADFTM